MTEFDRDIESVMRGRLAGRELAIIEPLLDELESRVDRRVIAQLKNEKGLTEQQALQAWYEKAAVVQLREKLQHLVNSGKSAGRRVAPTMEEKNGQA